MIASMRWELDPSDLDAVTAQLGREPRGKCRVAARCPCGLPTVIQTFPEVDGNPFPNLYWLTCKRLVVFCSQLESTQAMVDLNERLASDPPFAEAYRAANEDYQRERDAIAPGAAGGVGGGPSDRVKCLHAHLAHYLAGRPNPVGEWVAAQQPPVVGPCVSQEL